MKSKKNIKKLEFNKETIARLGEMELGKFYGGKETESINLTKPGQTCTCFTRTSELQCE